MGQAADLRTRETNGRRGEEPGSGGTRRQWRGQADSRQDHQSREETTIAGEHTDGRVSGACRLVDSHRACGATTKAGSAVGPCFLPAVWRTLFTDIHDTRQRNETTPSSVHNGTAAVVHLVVSQLGPSDETTPDEHEFSRRLKIILFISRHLHTLGERQQPMRMWRPSLQLPTPTSSARQQPAS